MEFDNRRIGDYVDSWWQEYDEYKYQMKYSNTNNTNKWILILFFHE